MAEIALVGPFTTEQTEIINSGLPGHHVDTYQSANMVPDHSIVAVRGSVPIPAVTTIEKKVNYVISGGRGTDNIEAHEGLQIGDCRGVNAMETASHAVALMLSKIQSIYTPDELQFPQNIPVGIIGPGFVGTNIALLMKSMGFENLIFAQREGKGNIPTLHIYDDLDLVLAHADLLFIAAPGDNIIHSKNVGLVDATDLIVNVARGSTIVPTALDHLRKIGSNVSYTTDVWHEEPKVGNKFPNQTAFEIGGNEQCNATVGTMHQAGRQASCNIQMAKMLSSKLQLILSGRDLPVADDPIESYKKALLTKSHTKLDLTRVIDHASDVTRVRILKQQLTSLAMKVIMGQSIIWQQPDIIKPKSGVAHDLVQQLQLIHS